MLQEAWSYQELYSMPIRDLLNEINYIAPKLKEIARQREANRLTDELSGKKPRISRYRSKKGLGK